MSPRPSQDRLASHGRGGAGNIAKDDPNAHLQPADLVTPTLKGDHYTTGRGGSGNMAKNDPNHPELARAAQDVDAPRIRESERPHHFGRGGANIVEADEEHAARGSKSPELKPEGAGANNKGLLDKGKDLLHKLGSKK